MDKLPEKIGKYPVVIQYAPPKWLGPSEVWILYNQKYEDTNFECLLYKRQFEWLINIEDKWNWTIILYRNKEIDYNIPSFEMQYWIMIFWTERKDRVLWGWHHSKLSKGEKLFLHLELIKYCFNKWRLYKLGKIVDFNTWCFLVICSAISPFIIVLWILIFFIYKISNNKKEDWEKYKYEENQYLRTDKWDELYAHILWYKYWLEKCEENQMLEILKKDPNYVGKNLPYIIALRMNWKFLDKKFNK
jgi:uncharacterized membrane protein